jgi:anti-sigma factor RsiW
MDHAEALRLEAAEKYVLKELSPTQMEEYEAHFFDCAECLRDIKAATAFADAAREHFRQHPVQELVPQQAPASAGWRAWLKPAFAVPVLAAVLVFVGYQALETSQKLPQQSADSSTQGPLLVASLQSHGESFQLHGLARGEQGAENADCISVHAAQSVDLKFDFLPAQSFSQYIGRLQDESGRRVLGVSFSGDLARREVHIPVPAGALHAGKYVLVIAGDPSASGKFLPKNESARFHFMVEVLP